MSELYDRADNMFGELVIPESFSEALSYAEQLIWLYLHKQNELIEGENITITDNGDGTVTISASVDGVKGIDRIESTVQTDKTVVVIYYTDGTFQSFNVLAGPQGPQGIQGIPGQDGAPGVQGDPGNGIKSIEVTNVETVTVETKVTRINPDESSVSQTFQKQIPKRSVLTITYDDDTTDTVYAYAGASSYVGETVHDMHVTPNTNTIKFKMYNPADGMIQSLQEFTISDGAQGPQGIQGIQGVPGQDGQDGRDGRDGQDGAPGPQGEPGVGVPAGGTTDEILIKASDADYVTRWCPKSDIYPTIDTVGNQTNIIDRYNIVKDKATSGFDITIEDSGNNEITLSIDNTNETSEPFYMEWYLRAPGEGTFTITSDTTGADIYPDYISTGFGTFFTYMRINVDITIPASTLQVITFTLTPDSGSSQYYGIVDNVNSYLLRPIYAINGVPAFDTSMDDGTDHVLVPSGDSGYWDSTNNLYPQVRGDLKGGIVKLYRQGIHNYCSTLFPDIYIDCVDNSGVGFSLTANNSSDQVVSLQGYSVNVDVNLSDDCTFTSDSSNMALSYNSDLGLLHIDWWDDVPAQGSITANITATPGSNYNYVAWNYTYTYDVLHDSDKDVPAGGTEGQVLTKNSGNDYDTKWGGNVSGVATHSKRSIGSTWYSTLSGLSGTNFTISYQCEIFAGPYADFSSRGYWGGVQYLEASGTISITNTITAPTSLTSLGSFSLSGGLVTLRNHIGDHDYIPGDSSVHQIATIHCTLVLMDQNTNNTIYVPVQVIVKCNKLGNLPTSTALITAEVRYCGVELPAGTYSAVLV